MQSLDPPEGARGVANQVVLASVHHDLGIIVQEYLLDQAHLVLHEVFIECLLHVEFLLVELYGGVQAVQIQDLVAGEVAV
jgi:hypothetical protein